MKLTTLDTAPTTQTGTIISDVVDISGMSTPVFNIDATDWTEPEQSMIVHLQISNDGGDTWEDLIVAPCPVPPWPFSISNELPDPQDPNKRIPVLHEDGTLARLLCEVTGDITFGISGRSE